MAFLRTTSAGSTPRSSTSSDGGLTQICLEDHYRILRELGSGTYGQSILVQCRATGKQIAIKMMNKTSTKFVDFLREFQMSYFLSPHPAIVSSYDVAFETPSHFAFAQEYAPLGDLFDCIEPQRGLAENSVKLITTQLVSALDFMHSKGIVHRDVKPENVLVFQPDFSRIKLVDFGMTRQAGTLVRKTGEGIPYTPPEISQTPHQETYVVHPWADVWALGVLTFSALTGNFPWEMARESDPHFQAYLAYHRGGSVVSWSSWNKPPLQFDRITPRLMQLLGRMLEPRPEKRCHITELRKYLNDGWLRPDKQRTVSASIFPNDVNSSLDAFTVETTGEHPVAVPTPPFSAGPEETRIRQLERMLNKCGVQTRVSRKSRDRRIHDWLFRATEKRISIDN